MDSVRSVRYQQTSTTVSTTAKNALETAYLMCSLMCIPSAAIVPKIATMSTASQ